jgi:uncharacterized SAM-binding protein YcdF (DUF218 family)
VSFLVELILPPSLAVGVLLVAFFSRRWWIVALGIGVLLVPSLPVTADTLAGRVEGGRVRLPAASMPTADAVVVLSGGRSVAPGEESFSEWGDADRFFGGLELMAAERAPLLVFTGGVHGPHLEGDVLRRYALVFGLPAESIRTTGPVSNTSEEATAVAELLFGLHQTRAVPHVLLVTSAFHVDRAARAFEREGLRVTPFPVDFIRPAAARIGPRTWVPTASALAESRQMLRELLGRAVYQIGFLR